VRSQSRRPKIVRCRHCKSKLKVKAKGPLPLYCRGCRQRVYEKRRYLGPMELLAQDIATARVRDLIRAEVRSLLSQIGVEIPPRPQSSAAEKRRSHLQLVHSESTDT
jgi:hypothetical protein